MSLKLPPMPARIAKLPLDHRGYPVPYFVAWIDGKPDHRVADPYKMARARDLGLCNLCGEKLGTHKAFVIGPMCSVNRISAEPPSHRDCAEFAVKACPFLSIPTKAIRGHNLPEGIEAPKETRILHNPGTILIWITRDFTWYKDMDAVGGEGVLYRLGEPDTTLWYCEGRPATRAEALKSLTTGLPFLMQAAKAEGPEAEKDLHDCLAQATAYLPPDDGTVSFPGITIETVPAQAVVVEPTETH